MPSISDVDGKQRLDKLQSKILAPATSAVATSSVEDYLAGLERSAGLVPDSNDQDGRQRRLARLERVYGIKLT